MSPRMTGRPQLSRVVAGSVLAATVTLAVLAVALIAAAASPSGAAADADPASDVLLGLPVFYPYTPAVATALQDQLQQELAELARRGLNMKVAIIGSSVDLGAIPVLFGKPQTYANFLDREISFEHPQPLLVVMPQGFGLANIRPTGALDGLKVDTTDGSNGLARSAIVAVARIARAAGKPIAVPAASTGGRPASSGNSSLIGVGALAAVLVLGACSAVFLRRRALQARRPVRKRRQSSRRSRPGRRGNER